MITFSSVSKTFEDGTEGLKSLDFRIREGEFFVLIGPSGCGKTTALKMINRLIEPTTGEIRIRDREVHTFNIHELRWNIGYVLQQIALFPHLTVAENIAVVPEMRRWSKERIRKRVDELLDMVGLEPSVFRGRKPAELSGGQQQRIGVVRALAGDPEMIVMDEPFSALDPITREQLQQDIRNLQQEIRKTVVFVTHDMDEAMALGDRVCLMRQGEAVQIDTPQNLITRPVNSFVRQFIGDRKTAWLTAVDVMMEPADPYLTTEERLAEAEGRGPVRLPLYVRDQQGHLKGEWNGHSLKTDILAIENDTKLRDAVRLFQEADREVLPVVKGNRLVGVLSYRSIVSYLEKSSREGEVGSV
ncbi:ABC transporter ATP-binding protein [Paludifilum halophilum]|uniref:Carnitine transport ATP-binding protein OpuCA n=1 Tax=Paludifilum halophilum TaxID=1642702 RepID=A0A235B3P3_9BACL|nr:ABC transporter ATP-binding protein [Paludifilum halophilum]OYD06852.1 choline ABC transporter ATP-binding protein [Paludifilum halophilum]